MIEEERGLNILVFDVGTSALKAVVFSPAGEILAHSDAEYARPVLDHRQSPWDWWGAAVVAARRLHFTDVGAIALTGTMENLIPINPRGEPLGDALLYADPCGIPFMAEAQPGLDEADATRVCGNAPEPLMTAFKLAWLRMYEPERFDQAACFLPGSKDFLALRLTGELVTDPTCAATTGLMDMASRDWANSLRTVFGIERRRLPHIRPATDVIGKLTPGAAEELGLAAGIPVVNGSGDGGATTMGGGADSAGEVSLYIGTTGWVARVVGGGTLGRSSNFYRLPHPVGEGIIEIAPILSAGAATIWVRDVLSLNVDDAERLAAAADQSPPELMFLPYLNGERSPFLDLDVRGGFFGLSSRHGPGAMYYGVLEGVALAIEANLRNMGGAGRRVSLVGGGALSAVWTQMIADIIGVPILSPPDPVAATSFGAFRIAQRALRQPLASGSLNVVAQPRAERRERADRLRERFAHATDLIRQFR